MRRSASLFLYPSITSTSCSEEKFEIRIMVEAIKTQLETTGGGEFSFAEKYLKYFPAPKPAVMEKSSGKSYKTLIR